jgi:membrane-associated progesterone receptor component
MLSSEYSIPVYALLLSLPLAFFYYRHFYRPSVDQPVNHRSSDDKPLKTIMQAPRDDLAPPKDDPFTLEQLKQYDGSDPAKPIYVAIKGLFDSVLFLCWRCQGINASGL